LKSEAIKTEEQRVICSNLYKNLHLKYNSQTISSTINKIKATTQFDPKENADEISKDIFSHLFNFLLTTPLYQNYK